MIICFRVNLENSKIVILLTENEVPKEAVGISHEDNIENDLCDIKALNRIVSEYRIRNIMDCLILLHYY